MARKNADTFFAWRENRKRLRPLKYPYGYIHPTGYVQVALCFREANGRWQCGYKLAHRVVMEQVMGRKLLSEEHVHHADGDKLNNRPDNLFVLPASSHRSVSLREGRRVLRERRSTSEGRPHTT